MRNKLLLTLVASALVLVSCGESTKTATLEANSELKNIPEEFETYENFFKDDRIPDQFQEYGIGDPFIYRFNGVYYMCCSTKATVKGVKAWKSTDLIHWEKVRNGVTKDGYILGDDIDESFDAWASEVYYFDGYFYLIESRHGKGHYVFRSTSPEGPFELYSDGMIDGTIDGSTYMDIDGRMLMVNASGTFAGKHFADDMKSVIEDMIKIPVANMNGWTEGPELFTRNGIRYYIYTGNGVSQRAYRCDYSYGYASDPVLDDTNVRTGHNLILNTTDEWYGLGHTTVCVGPDLDSWYMGFHNSYAEGNSGGRRFNIARMLFNDADITMQHVGLYDNIVPNLPDYREPDFANLVNEGSFLLSNEATGDSFTVEFNAAGSGKMVFSYVNSNNYGYLSFDGNYISINKVSNGKTNEVNKVKTYRTFNKDVLHTYRIGYKEGLMDVTFDLQEIANDVEVGEFKAGKVGYESSLTTKGCLTYNNTAQGDSDKKTAKQEIIPVTTYSENVSKLSEDSGLKKAEDFLNNDIVKESSVMSLNRPGDYVTYLEYISEQGTYGLDLTIPVSEYGKTIGVQIDGGAIQKWTLPDYSSDSAYKGYVRCKLANLSLSKGNHYITFVDLADSVKFQRIFIERNTPQAGLVYEESLTSYPEKGISYPTFMNCDSKGFYTDTTKRSLVTFGDGTLEDVEMSCDIQIFGDVGTGTFGLTLACDKWAFNNTDLDNYKSIRGYYFALNRTKVTIIDSDYQYTIENCRDIYMFDSDTTYNIKAVKQGKVLKMYVNDVQVLQTFSASGPTRGYCGLYSNFMNARFFNLKIKTL